MFGARVAYTMDTPAFLARPSNAAMAGIMPLMHFGWDVQMGSTMSSTNIAVVCPLRTTGTGSGNAGICSGSNGLLAALLGAPGAGDCATAAPPQAVSRKPLVRR